MDLNLDPKWGLRSMTAEPKLIEYKFEFQWGGEDTWFTKASRWAQKQKYPINHLTMGFIVWLWEKWVDGKVELEMASVDKQAENIKNQWENDDEQPEPEIVETGVFGDEDWSIRISNPVVEGRTKKSDTSMGTGSNEVRLE